jgi:hypothetical protein
MGDQLKDALKAAGLAGTRQKAPRPGSAAAAGSPGAKKASEAARKPATKVPSNRNVCPPPTPKRDSPRGSSPSPIHIRPAVASPSALPIRPPTSTVSPVPLSVKPVCRLVKVGEFHPHPLFDPSGQKGATFPVMAESGIAGQLTEHPDNETDLVVGLDFGTSTTKVVIRDRLAATGVFPIKFLPDVDGIGAYLVASRVFRTGETYSLMQGTEDAGNLKLGLLACKSARPVVEFNDCCAFLALIIRRARGEFLSSHRALYARHRLNWHLNLGLAARSYEDARMVTLFRRLAWAAMATACDAEAPEITSGVVDQYRRTAFELFQNPSEGLADSERAIDVVPEVSAQLQGFMASARWDWSSRPVMMLVDVGAGTVDSALFHVRTPASGDSQLTFYSSRVEPNGVMNLHRQRVEWLRSLLPPGAEHAEARLHLEQIAAPTGRLRPIPAVVGDYLPGYRVESSDIDVDQKFRLDRYRAQVAGSINDAKVKKGLGREALKRVPLLLCGGGSRMDFYGSIVREINDTQGWGDVSVELTRLPVPGDLAETGWHADDFDRLSVAYGLSLAGHGESSLGRIVRSIEVPDVRPNRRDDDDGSRYISKDQM